MEDSEIVELYFERSEKAVQETDRKYNAFLSQVAYNILRSLRDTEEIVNDTYMSVWNAIPPTRPNSLKHFLSRITRNLSFDRLDYNNAKKRNALLVEMNECIPDQRNNIEELWEAQEIGRVLNGFLRTLDRQTCAIFLARYYYVYSIKELAQQYALPTHRVKYLLSRTRNELRSYLEKEGVVI